MFLFREISHMILVTAAALLVGSCTKAAQIYEASRVIRWATTPLLMAGYGLTALLAHVLIKM